MLKPYTEFCFVFQSSVPTAHTFECRMMCMAERRCAFSSCKPASQYTVMFALLLSEILHVAMFSTWWFILTHLLLVRTFCLKPRCLLFYSGYCLYFPLSFTTAATSIIFVATKVLSRDKHVFVTTKHVFCRDKVCLSWQTFSKQVNKHAFVATY